MKKGNWFYWRSEAESIVLKGGDAGKEGSVNKTESRQKILSGGSLLIFGRHWLSLAAAFQMTKTSASTGNG